MMIFYSHHYWIVAGDESYVFSSKEMSLVPVSDADYIAWLESGNEPAVVDSQNSLDNLLAQRVLWLSASAWQIKAALTQLGWRADVETAISSADQDTKDAWAVQQYYQFNNSRIMAVATIIGKTRNDVIELVKLASTLRP